MSKLKSLAERVAALPARRKTAKQLGRLTEFAGKLKSAVEDVSAAAIEAGNAKGVFRDFAEADGLAARDRKAARSLRDKLAQDVERVTDEATNNHVTRLREASSAVRTEVLVRWGREVKKVYAPYEKLAAVATRRDFPGAAQLSAFVERLKNHAKKSPATAAAAGNVESDIAALRTAITSLGLEDEAVRKFLEEAGGDGGASLKPLSLDRAVFDFLDRHKLWDLFRVRAV